MPETTMDDVRSFIARHKWTFAKTMPENPHEYVVRKKCDSDDAFVAVVLFIREHGYKEKWGKATYTYLEVDGWRYWTMGAPIKSTIILNRAVVKPKEAASG